jgi:hypothetical protein
MGHAGQGEEELCELVDPFAIHSNLPPRIRPFLLISLSLCVGISPYCPKSATENVFISSAPSPPLKEVEYALNIEQ